MEPIVNNICRLAGLSIAVVSLGYLYDVTSAKPCYSPNNGNHYLVNSGMTAFTIIDMDQHPYHNGKIVYRHERLPIKNDAGYRLTYKQDDFISDYFDVKKDITI